MNAGINPRLLEVVKAINEYCYDNSVEYDIACDESDLQGVKIFQKDVRFLNGLLRKINPLLEANAIHLETERVRGGTILALSLETISEKTIEDIVRNIGESIEPIPFKEKIDLIIAKKPNLEALKEEGEVCNGQETGNVVKGAKKGSKKGANQKSSKGMAVKFENAKPKYPVNNNNRFTSLLEKALSEDLSGMATPNDTNPDEIFKKFAKAMQVLGKQMGAGPLQDRLKEQGIKWKKSDDGLKIILYAMNAQTKAPMPIAQISAETIEKPKDFEEALKNILDFSKGEAPGSFDQTLQSVKDQQSAIADISKAVSPQENEIQQQFKVQQDQGMVPDEGQLDLDAAQRAASLK